MLCVIGHFIKSKFFYSFSVIGNGAAFASRVTSYPISGSTSPVPMSDVLTNHGDHWDTGSHVFRLSALKGFFWVGLIVGNPANTPVDFRLNRNGSPVGGITRTSTSHNANDTISHELLTYMETTQTLYVSSDYPLWSDHERQTGLTIFCVSDAMETDTFVAFSVARDETLSGYANPVPFIVELYNEGLGYDNESHKFTAPSSGIYYFTFSLGLLSEGTANFTIFKNNERFGSLYRTSTSHDGIDMMSRSMLLFLDEDDDVYMVNDDKQDVWSSPQLQTSFSGFKYEPMSGPPVCRLTKNYCMIILCDS